MTTAGATDPRETATNLKAQVVLHSVGLVTGCLAVLLHWHGVLLGLLGLCSLGLLIAICITRGIWTHRCWANAELLAPGSQRLRRGWAVWCWLVPVANLWLPRRVLLDLWSAGGVPTRPRPVHLWWVSQLVRFALALLTLVPGLWPVTLPLTGVVTMVQTVAMVRVVSAITARQADALDLPPIRELGERAVQRA